MASAFALPLADQISTWTELNPHGGHDTSSDQPFHQRIQDKSTFYRFSAAEWDRSSEKSYQLWDDYDIIHEHAAAIAKLIRPGDTILEYGPGASGKVLPITSRIDRSCAYIGIDMHRPFLEHTIAQVSKQSRGIQASGIEADFVHLPEIISMVEGPRFIISFGSNLFNHHDPLEQLRPIADKMSVGDHIYLSIDCHGINDSQKIKKSYETREFTQFIKGTLDRMPGYRPEQWDLSSKVQDKYGCRHFFCLEANEDVLIGDMFYPKNKIIEFFPCYKSTKDKVDEVCSKLDLAVSRIFEREGTKMTHFLIRKVEAL